jgi:hypothetical protein
MIEERRQVFEQKNCFEESIHFKYNFFVSVLDEHENHLIVSRLKLFV